MYRIRFHGRGGQGMKTSSRILGSAFFKEGYEVQDAPKYGAERRGASMSAYVRADRKNIYERGVIQNPDLVVAADESLLMVIPELIFEGLNERSMLLLNSSGNIDELQERLDVKSEVVYLPLKLNEKDKDTSIHLISTASAAAAAALTGAIAWDSLEKAIHDELFDLTDESTKENIETALYTYENIIQTGKVLSGRDALSAYQFRNPGWVTMETQHAGLSAPAIHNSGTSAKNPTGSWRTVRPEIREDICSRCSLCSVYCPDNAIKIDETGLPVIDYTHCKGCLICLSICPKHAIESMPESSPFKRKHYRGEL